MAGRTKPRWYRDKKPRPALTPLDPIVTLLLPYVQGAYIFVVSPLFNRGYDNSEGPRSAHT